MKNYQTVGLAALGGALASLLVATPALAGSGRSGQIRTNEVSQQAAGGVRVATGDVTGDGRADLPAPRMGGLLLPARQRIPVTDGEQAPAPKPQPKPKPKTDSRSVPPAGESISLN